MKRRLTIARALINQPEVLLLDEPTTGLDPQARHLLWDRLYRLKQTGVTLVLTTHYMDEAEQLCDRLVIMDGGRIVAEGSPRELIAEHATREVVEVRFDTRVRAGRRAGRSVRTLRRSGRAARRPRARLHRRRRRAPRPRSRATASAPRRCSCGGRASRTCSSSSPAARSRTEAHDVSTPPVLRVVEREMRVSRARLWRGAACSRRSSARCCSSRRWASGSAASSTRTSGTVAGLTLPRLRRARACSSRARCSSRPASRCGRCSAAVKWMQQLPRHRRDADHGPASSFGGLRALDRAPRACSARPRSCSSRRCSARCRRRGACSRSRPPALCAAAFCAPLAAFSVDAGHRPLVPGDHAARRPAAVPVLGHVLPDHAAARLAATARGRSRRCGTASSSPRQRRPATSTAGADVVHVAVLVACIGAGLAGAARVRAAVDA